jgi:hypothetical protein
LAGGLSKIKATVAGTAAETILNVKERQMFLTLILDYLSYLWQIEDLVDFELPWIVTSPARPLDPSVNNNKGSSTADGRCKLDDTLEIPRVSRNTHFDAFQC